MAGPHDRFFRYLFNAPARAEALLRHNLPEPFVAQVDWPSLRRESGTLVEGNRETRQDLLFSARLLHAAEPEPPHFFLIEHQSSVERWMALRLHDYAWRLITHWREVHPHSRWIPGVTALVVYPRRGRRWSAPLRLEDHYNVRVWAAGPPQSRGWNLLRSEYRVDDLSTQSEQAVRARPGPPLVPLGLLVLSYAGTEQLAQRLPHWTDLFAQVHASAHGPQAAYRVVRYLHHLGDVRVLEAINRVLQSIMESERAEAIMKTAAEVLREQGHQKGVVEGEARGLAKGRASGMAGAILRLLAAKRVPVDERSRQRIEACMDVATLEHWLDRALNATRISEVLDEPGQSHS